MTPETLQQWQGSNIAFWLTTGLVLVSGFVAALSRNIVQAAFGLFFTLFGVAGYYVLLGSGFLAVTQIIVYVGGILVLLMFGILLTLRPLQRDQEESPWMYALGAAISLSLLALIEMIIASVRWPVAQVLTEPANEVRPLGKLLLSTYVLPFEVAGMTLLLCLIGAAYLVRRRER